MKKILLITFSIFLTSNTSWAADNGFSIELAGGYQKTKMASDNAADYNRSPSSTLSSDSIDDKNDVWSVAAEYLFEVNSNVGVALGADYYFGDIDLGKLPFNDSAAGTTTYTSTWNLKDTFNIYLKPYYKLNENQSIYAKAGYARTTIEYTDTATDVTVISL